MRLTRHLAADARSPTRVSLLVRAVCLPVLLAALAVAQPASAETVRLGGTGSGMGTMQRLAEAYHAIDPSFQLDIVPNLGSSGGARALASGAIQIAVVSRPLKPKEAEAGLRTIEYGTTAFVLATSKPGVHGVTLRELAGYYSGQRTHWPDGVPVRIVMRPASDADSDYLAAFSPEMKLALEHARSREGMVTGLTDQETVDAIERLPGGLGTASMALLLSEGRRAKPLSVGGIEPTLANVASGRYPHTKTMYLVLRNDANEATMGFVRFIGSDAGAKVLANNGHLLPGAKQLTKSSAGADAGR